MDTDKVRSMLAQVEGGVAEEERNTNREDSKSEGGVKGFVGHSRSWGEERYVQKSLGDSIFPSLEESLESNGLLSDISEEAADSEYWSSGRMQRDFPPGSIIRVTAPGSLFDARYIASIFSSFATTAVGLGMLVGDGQGNPATPPRAAKKQQRPVAGGGDSSAPLQLEDGVVDFIFPGITDQMNAAQLRSLIKIARSVFLPGLHLNLNPTGDDGFSVGARLQEGRQYLDTDPDILFARYGTGEQEWTLVGSIGHYGSPPLSLSEAPAEFIDANGVVNRGRMARMINGFVGTVGGLGFADLPQAPSFSVVPFAVYRTMPIANGQIERLQ